MFQKEFLRLQKGQNLPSGLIQPWKKKSVEIKYTETGKASVKPVLQGKGVSAETSPGILTARWGLLAYRGNVPEPLLARALVLCVILPPHSDVTTAL